MEEAAKTIFEVYDELIRCAAQGELFHNDDTVAKILSLVIESLPEEKGKKERKAVQTSGIVSIKGREYILGCASRFPQIIREVY